MIFYQLIVFAVTAASIIYGFRRGMARQVPSAVGTAFGIVCCHIFSHPLSKFLSQAFPMHVGHVEEEAYYGVLACSLIFAAAFLTFTFLTSFTGKALAEIYYNVADHIFGALFALFKGLLLLSVILNLILAVNPRSGLLAAGRHDDGNAVELVMIMGAGVLGFESVETTAHKVQIEDARKISRGENRQPYVPHARLDCGDYSLDLVI